eukprot:COSAG01_NODE_8806_length_2653_cov_3.282302_1_plen_82_part_00
MMASFQGAVAPPRRDGLGERPAKPGDIGLVSSVRKSGGSGAVVGFFAWWGDCAAGGGGHHAAMQPTSPVDRCGNGSIIEGE